MVPGLCAEQISGDPQMAQSCDPWNAQHVREMEISWEAVLRQRALSRQGDGKSDVVNEQCGQRNEL